MSSLDPATVGRLHQVRALGTGPRRASRRRWLVLVLSGVLLAAAGWLRLAVGGLRP